MVTSESVCWIDSARFDACWIKSNRIQSIPGHFQDFNLHPRDAAGVKAEPLAVRVPPLQRIPYHDAWPVCTDETFHSVGPLARFDAVACVAQDGSIRAPAMARATDF